MADSNGKKSVREQLTGIEGKLDRLIDNHQIICETVKKHEVEIYGIAGSQNSIGVIRRVDGIGNRLDNIVRFGALIWTGIFTAIQFLIGFIKHRGS